MAESGSESARSLAWPKPCCRAILIACVCVGVGWLQYYPTAQGAQQRYLDELARYRSGVRAERLHR